MVIPLPRRLTAMINVEQVTRDPSLSEDPDRFNPDRFLPLFDKSIKCDMPPFDPIAHTFGFRRRICSRMNYADKMLFLTMASMLTTFDMKPPGDDAGWDILPEVRFSSHMIREALPLKFSRAHSSVHASGLMQ
ncbi:hypothetical protein BD779DRAFT_1556862 [Infundibulicybe gibba]|nr:hypothetical protein BD779DRAFT_1556862 [Infundibulicybe gibba]